MALVERGNVVLEVEDDNVQKYIDKGFSVRDAEGNILQRALPNTVGELRKLVVAQQNEIEELQEKIKALESGAEEKKRTKRKKAEE